MHRGFPLTLLAIESSCDETAAALLQDGLIKANVIANQSVHEAYGGIVPELASREHQKNIVPVVQEALKQAGVDKTDLQAIAFTQGPGLLGSLLVGSSFAKSLAMALQVPLIAVNHMQAHILAHFIEPPFPVFPFLCLTVSGGHTQLVQVNDYLNMKILGQTRDDAVGEAFDKSAKMLGLSYPGGPLIDRYAQKGQSEAFRFPATDLPGLDFSFSGIKTALLYFIQAQQAKNPDFIQDNIADLCASIQHALVQMLLKKLQQASQQTGIREIAIAGGVSANSGLRAQLLAKGQELGWQVYLPKFEYCTDNAAMIAMSAYLQYQHQDFADWGISAAPRLKFGV